MDFLSALSSPEYSTVEKVGYGVTAALGLGAVLWAVIDALSSRQRHYSSGSDTFNPPKGLPPLDRLTPDALRVKVAQDDENFEDPALRTWIDNLRPNFYAEPAGKPNDELLAKAVQKAVQKQHAKKAQNRSGLVPEICIEVALIPSLSELPLTTGPTYQAELRQFEQSLNSPSFGEVSSAIAHSQSSTSTNLGEFTIKLAAIFGPLFGTIIGAWLQAKYGRKVRLKIGDIEAEAHTREEVEKLLARAQEIQQINQHRVIP